jgi:hypothetical protein
MMSRIDKVVDTTAKEINVARNRLREATGDRPFGSREMTYDQKMTKLLETLEDDAYWQVALDSERGTFTLEPGAAPKRLIKEVAEMMGALPSWLERQKGNGAAPTASEGDLVEG